MDITHLVKAELESICKHSLKMILQSYCLLVAWLAHQHDVIARVSLDVVWQIHSIEVWHCLESGKLLGCFAHSTDVLSFDQIEVFAVELITSIEFRCYSILLL